MFMPVPYGVGEPAADDPALAAKGPVLILRLKVPARLQEQRKRQAAQPVQQAQQLQPLRVPAGAVLGGLVGLV